MERNYSDRLAAWDTAYAAGRFDHCNDLTHEWSDRIARWDEEMDASAFAEYPPDFKLAPVGEQWWSGS